MELLVVLRVLQGAAGAVLVRGSLALITVAFKDREEHGAYCHRPRRCRRDLADALIVVAITSSFYAGLQARVPDIEASSAELRG